MPEPIPQSRPFAPAAERNKQPILEALQLILSPDERVFEFGSGTAQHACHIAQAMPRLVWQPSDLPDTLPGIRQWIAESGCTNILPPIELDLQDTELPAVSASVCFTANTVHIVGWRLVQQLFLFSSKILEPGGKLIAYGPFMIDGQHSSHGNRIFDDQLRASDADSGIRDIAELDTLALDCGFTPARRVEMPANNLLLHWVRDAST